MGSAESVAKTALRSLGRKDAVVPGISNKVMAVMMDRLMSRKIAKSFIGFTLKKAFRQKPLLS